MVPTNPDALPNDFPQRVTVMKKQSLFLALGLAAGVAAAAVPAWNWWQGRQAGPPAGLVSANGRIESDQVDVAARSAGRLTQVLVREGDLVEADQVVAQISVAELNAHRAKYAADLAMEQATMLQAKATVAQRRAELTLKEANLKSATPLARSGAISGQALDEAQSERDAARAVLEAAQTYLTARERSIDSAKALVAQTDTQIADATLKSPVRGRVLYRLANPGEVLAAGGKVLTIVDLSRVYMEIFVPAQQASRIALGSQARIQLDAVDFAVPAKVSFVSPDAQFTPKSVETRSERDKLVFRVRLRVPQSLIDRHVDQVKTGVRGTGYVRLDPNPLAWPESLQKRGAGDPIDAVD